MVWGPGETFHQGSIAGVFRGELLKAALQELRRRLADFQERSDRPIESKLRLLERHLFRSKFGYATLDKGINWNPWWRIDLEEN